MTLPAFCASRCAAAARQPLKTPTRLTSRVARKSSGDISATGATCAMPELFTSTSRPPSSAMVRPTSASTSAIGGDVGLDHHGPPTGRGDQPRGLLQLGPGARGHRHVGARLRQRHRHGAPEAAAGPGHDGHPAVEALGGRGRIYR